MLWPDRCKQILAHFSGLENINQGNIYIQIQKKIDITLNLIYSTQKKINYILLMSWQVSNQCMALVNDKIIVPTKVGALMT